MANLRLSTQLMILNYPNLSFCFFRSLVRSFVHLSLSVSLFFHIQSHKMSFIQSARPPPRQTSPWFASIILPASRETDVLLRKYQRPAPRLLLWYHVCSHNKEITLTIVSCRTNCFPFSAPGLNITWPPPNRGCEIYLWTTRGSFSCAGFPVGFVKLNIPGVWKMSEKKQM